MLPLQEDAASSLTADNLEKFGKLSASAGPPEDGTLLSEAKLRSIMSFLEEMEESGHGRPAAAPQVWGQGPGGGWGQAFPRDQACLIPPPPPPATSGACAGGGPGAPGVCVRGERIRDAAEAGGGGEEAGRGAAATGAGNAAAPSPPGGLPRGCHRPCPRPPVGTCSASATPEQSSSSGSPPPTPRHSSGTSPSGGCRRRRRSWAGSCGSRGSTTRPPSSGT